MIDRSPQLTVPCSLGLLAPLLAYLDIQPLDLLVEGREGDVELLGGGIGWFFVLLHFT